MINPYKGFNDIEFGLSPREIEKKLKKRPRKVLKQNYDKYETDAYDDLYIYYDEEGKCEAVEFNCGAKLIFNKAKIFEKSYQDIESFIGNMDPDIEIDEVGFTSYKFGIGVYAPYKSEINSKVESVIIFKRGYYDR